MSKKDEASLIKKALDHATKLIEEMKEQRKEKKK